MKNTKYQIDQNIKYVVNGIVIDGVFSDYHYTDHNLCWVFDDIFGNHTIEIKNIIIND